MGNGIPIALGVFPACKLPVGFIMQPIPGVNHKVSRQNLKQILKQGKPARVCRPDSKKLLQALFVKLRLYCRVRKAGLWLGAKHQRIPSDGIKKRFDTYAVAV